MVLKVTTSWKELSQEMKCGSTITSQTVNTRIWNRNILILLPRRSSEQIQLQESLPFSFWDSQGLLLEHYQERGSTVTIACYSEILCDKIKPAI